MKPAWDKLMKQFKDSATVLVADVDCTAGGEELCQEVGVQGYPTIKYGDPSDLQDYEGGRDFEELKKFASELGPMCSPANIDVCDDAKKKQIEQFLAMSAEDRNKKIEELTEKQKGVEKEFETFVEGLQKQYEEAEKKKEAGIEEIKKSGLGIMKSVLSHLKKGGDKGAEL